MPTVLVALEADPLTTDDLAAYGYWLGLGNVLALLADPEVRAEVGPVGDVEQLMRLSATFSSDFGFNPGVAIRNITSTDGLLHVVVYLPPNGGGLLLKVLAIIRDRHATTASTEFEVARRVADLRHDEAFRDEIEAEDLRRSLVTRQLRARLFSQLAESGVPMELRAVTAEFVEHAMLPIVEIRVEADRPGDDGG